MILAVDLGNTTTSLALVSGKMVRQITQLDSNLSSREYRSKVQKLLGRYRRKARSLEGAVICSVVPSKVSIVSAAIKSVLKISPKVVGRTIKVPIKNRYRNPRQVGQDRLVCAYAAGQIYGKPAIVVDSGTAITFDILSKKNEYLGGIIAPGIRLSAESLFSKTALLPKIRIRAPKSIIGRDTQSSILSGLFYGYGVMILGLIQSISKKIKARPKVIATGGYTDILRKFVANRIDRVDKTLVFKGMGLLWESRS